MLAASKTIRPPMTRLPEKMVALAAIFLMLWLSAAYIIHQADTLAVHHQHHDCQLFAGIHHAIQSSAPILPVIASHGYNEPTSEIIRISLPFLAYFARSPPLVVQ
ncbi:DUF2607 family protein [Vibrio sp. MEBiC08052]|uniref:DUF2607 family protein n=1 Tax=Vibrio sp. MEBiC08052 TaxID=1761910 RepID=UPI00074074AB|nr:DUF2607 family protein [Vibrio sp. MEBiC08052]KUJ00831.1 hypothetical protein VRK_03330 [Vibrio sp. MEBiC08052]